MDYSFLDEYKKSQVKDNKSEGVNYDFLNEYKTKESIEDDTPVRDWLKSFYKGQQKVEDIEITPQIRERYEKQKVEPEFNNADIPVPVKALADLGGGTMGALSGLVRGADWISGLMNVRPQLPPELEAQRESPAKSIADLLARQGARSSEAGFPEGSIPKLVSQGIGSAAIDVPAMGGLGKGTFGLKKAIQGLGIVPVSMATAGGEAVAAGESPIWGSAKGAAMGKATEFGLGLGHQLPNALTRRAASVAVGAGMPAITGGTPEEIVSGGITFGLFPDSKKKQLDQKIAEAQAKANYIESKPTKLERPGPTVAKQSPEIAPSKHTGGEKIVDSRASSQDFSVEKPMEKPVSPKPVEIDGVKPVEQKKPGFDPRDFLVKDFGGKQEKTDIADKLKEVEQAEVHGAEGTGASIEAQTRGVRHVKFNGNKVSDYGVDVDTDLGRGEFDARIKLNKNTGRYEGEILNLNGVTPDTAAKDLGNYVERINADAKTAPVRRDWFAPKKDVVIEDINGKQKEVYAGEKLYTVDQGNGISKVTDGTTFYADTNEVAKINGVDMAETKPKDGKAEAVINRGVAKSNVIPNEKPSETWVRLHGKPRVDSLESYILQSMDRGEDPHEINFAGLDIRGASNQKIDSIINEIKNNRGIIFNRTIQPTTPTVAKQGAVMRETLKPTEPVPPEKKISRVITNTEAKQFGKKTATDLAKDFMEYDPSVRKEQADRAASELVSDGIEVSANKIINKKEPLDDYDMMKISAIEKRIKAEAKSPEDLRNPLLLGVMKARKESASGAAKIVEAQKYVDILSQPEKQAERHIKETIKKSPKLQKRERIAKSVTGKINKKFYEINKGVLSKFSNKITIDTIKLLRGQAKIDEVKFSELIKKHYTEIDATGKSLTDKIVEYFPVDKNMAQIMSDHIRNGFDILTRSAKRKYLDGLLGTKNKFGNKQDLSQKIIELSNRGAMSEEMFADIVSKKIGLPVLSPEHMFELNRQAQKIQETKNPETKIDEIGKLYSMLYPDVPKTNYQRMWDVRALGLLANAKTFERNIAGQGADALVTNLAKDIIGVRVDDWITKKLSLKLGEPTERTMVKTDWNMLIDKAKRAGRYGVADVQKKIDTLKARIEQTAKVKLGKDADKFGMGRPEFKEGGFMDKVQRGVAYGLQVPDRMFQEAVYWESYYNQIKALKPETRHNIPQALKQRISDQAWSEASQITYRQMNKFSKMVVGLQSKMGPIGKILLTFPKVAANIVYTGAYKYSPVGLGKGIADARKLIKSGGEIGNQRQIVFDISRGAAGSSVLVMGMLLGYLGTATGSTDPDINVQRSKEATGEQPGAIKLFGHSVRVDWVQPLSIMLELGAEVGKALREKGRGNVLESVADILTRATTSVVDQPLFTGLSRATSAGGKDMGEKTWNAVKSVALAGAASFIPTLSGQARQAIDPYQRELRRKHGEGTANSLKDFGFAAGALLLNKIPMASTLLEKRKDIFGKDVKYHQTGNLLFDVLDRFINPAIVSDLKNEPGIEFVLQLNRDKPISMRDKPLPRLTERTWFFTRDKKRYYLTPEQKSKYQELVGKEVYEFINEYQKSEKDSGRSIEEMATDIYKEIGNIGKRHREDILSEIE